MNSFRWVLKGFISFGAKRGLWAMFFGVSGFRNVGFRVQGLRCLGLSGGVIQGAGCWVSGVFQGPLVQGLGVEVLASSKAWLRGLNSASSPSGTVIIYSCGTFELQAP